MQVLALQLFMLSHRFFLDNNTRWGAEAIGMGKVVYGRDGKS